MSEEELIPVRRADCGHYVSADHPAAAVSDEHGYPVLLCNECLERVRRHQQPKVETKVVELPAEIGPQGELVAVRVQQAAHQPSKPRRKPQPRQR